jgi:transglutaminase-like putative cysteine protease
MRFEQALKLHSYLLLLAGFMTLLTAGGVSLPLAALYLAAVLLSWRTRTWRISTAVQWALVVALLGGFLADLWLLSSFVDALSHLLLAVSLIRLFSGESDRDRLLLYVISFVFVLLASTYTISIVFLGSLAVYLFFAILSFMLFESRVGYLQNPSAVFSHAAYLKTSSVVTVLIVLLAVPIFVVVPRGYFGFLRAGDYGFQNLTGFSDHVGLGDIGRLITSRQIVMRVRVDPPPETLPPDLKWRGIALDHFDGRNWANTRVGEQRVHTRGGRAEYLSNRRRQSEKQLGQTVLLEPVGRMVFGAPEIIQITRVTPSRITLTEDGNDSFRFYPVPAQRLRYVVYSDLMDRQEKLALARDYSGDLRDEQRYLQLPTLAPQIAQLAADLTRGKVKRIDKALALEHYLRTNLRYDLENRSALAEDPLFDFLFRGKAGHCEYFAAAQAVLMRSAGIPSRVVNGFRSGEYNAWSGHYIVRQSDAHSWVEGYFQGAGWIEFDATPPAVVPPSSFLVRWGSHWLDAIDAFWTEVITFDRIRQIGLIQSTARRALSLWQKTAQASETLDRWKVWLLEKIKSIRLRDLTWLAWAGAGLALSLTVYRYR